MRKQLLGSVAAVAIVAAAGGGAVEAADMKARPMAAPVPVWSWSGLTVGGHLGFARSRWDGYWDPSENPGVDFRYLNDSGIVGGMHIGYNWQLPWSAGGWASWVIGFEADFSAVGGMSAGDVFSGQSDRNNNCHPSFTAQCGARVDWLASMRGRLGLAIERVHVYGTVGLAFSNARAWAGSDTSSNNNAQLFTFNKLGVVYGFGFEFMAQQNLVLGVEFLRYDFNESQPVTSEVSSDEAPGRLTFKYLDVVRAKASWKW
jgi:outer membrane immunogenic protein